MFAKDGEERMTIQTEESERRLHSKQEDKQGGSGVAVMEQTETRRGERQRHTDGDEEGRMLINRKRD